jgi:tetratricopeptide (TPR) repeat protein
LLYEQGEFASAVKELDIALRIRPADPEFLLWKARALSSSGHQDEARSIVEALIKEDPLSPDAWFVLGRIEPSDEKALPCFQKVIQLDPKHAGALCSSAACLSNLGKWDEAILLFEQMGGLCPEHDSCETRMFNVCNTLMKLNRHQETLNACNELLSKHPNNLRALKIKAFSLAKTGRHSEGLELLASRLTENPADAELWYVQACIYALAKKVRKAAESLGEALAIDPKLDRIAEQDVDFNAVRGTKAFRNVLKAAKQRARRKACSSEYNKKKRSPIVARNRSPRDRE